MSHADTFRTAQVRGQDHRPAAREDRSGQDSVVSRDGQPHARRLGGGDGHSRTVNPVATASTSLFAVPIGRWLELHRGFDGEPPGGAGFQT